MLKKMVLLAAMGMGLSCSHILPQPSVAVNVSIEGDETRRFINRRSGGRIYFSPEKAEPVDKPEGGGADKAVEN